MNQSSDAQLTAAPPVVLAARFQRAGRLYYFKSGGYDDLVVGDRVLVETARGREVAEVVISPSQMLQAQVSGLKPILRRATWEELNELARLRTQEKIVLAEAIEHIQRHRLPMRAVRAEYAYDGGRLTIYFTSDQQRVDFRDLVRDLAGALGTRVQLRQIGPRDKAKLMGGLDRCGRELCCSSWMPEFQPISIRMAKTQGLSLNPSEISGVCGKLLCCLAFEDEQYSAMRDGLPKVGAKLTSAVGRGRVIDVNVFTRKVIVSWENGTRVEVDGDEFAEQRDRWKRAFGHGGTGSDQPEEPRLAGNEARPPYSDDQEASSAPAAETAEMRPPAADEDAPARRSRRHVAIPDEGGLNRRRSRRRRAKPRQDDA